MLAPRGRLFTLTIDVFNFLSDYDSDYVIILCLLTIVLCRFDFDSVSIDYWLLTWGKARAKAVCLLPADTGKHVQRHCWRVAEVRGNTDSDRWLVAAYLALVWFNSCLIYIYIYIHTYICVHIYIYIYIEREREREMYINSCYCFSRTTIFKPTRSRRGGPFLYITPALRYTMPANRCVVLPSTANIYTYTPII